MKFVSVALALAGLASATPVAPVPQPNEVHITGVSYAGSGCPAGSVASALSNDLTTLTMLYDSFVAQAGPGVTPSGFRKNCQLNVKLLYPQGWQFSVFKADYRGYAQIPQGDVGTCKSTYYFSGETRQMTSTLTIRGPFDDNYMKTDQFGVQSTVWSPCGMEGLLNINSEVRISPPDMTKNALLTVDSTDLKFQQIHYLQWARC